MPAKPLRDDREAFRRRARTVEVLPAPWLRDSRPLAEAISPVGYATFASWPGAPRLWTRGDPPGRGPPPAPPGPPHRPAGTACQKICINLLRLAISSARPFPGFCLPKDSSLKTKDYFSTRIHADQHGFKAGLSDAPMGFAPRSRAGHEAEQVTTDFTDYTD